MHEGHQLTLRGTVLFLLHGSLSPFNVLVAWVFSQPSSLQSSRNERPSLDRLKGLWSDSLIDRCVNLDTETARLSDELLDLAVVSGATGEVLFNSCVLQETMMRASQSVLGFAR